MPYKISWYQPERIIYVELEGLLTTAEVTGFSTQIYEMIASGKPLVHTITDTRLMRKLESIPEALKAVQATPVHSNGGWYIMVGSINPFVNFASDFVSSIMRSRYRRFDTVPQALAFLRDMDETVVITSDSTLIQPK